MKRPYYIAWTIAMVVLAILMLPYAWDIIDILFCKTGVSIARQLSIYKWAAIGAGAYVLGYPALKKNITFIETFSHESTHTFFAFLFGRRILSFNAGRRQGEIIHSGTGAYSLLPIALAPYCFPLATWLLLPWRCFIVEDMRWCFDIFVGITLAFHITCFVKQTCTYQTDINRYALPFSFAYIVLAHIANFCIIAVAFFPNMNDAQHYGLISSVWRFFTTLFGNACHLISLIG